MIAVNGDYITYYGFYRTIESKRTRHVSALAKGMFALPSGPFVEADVDVCIWRYRYYGERTYVENLFEMPEETLDPWRGR